MKHIWWINHHAIPPVVPGGTRHYSLAKEIMKLGDYKVTIINGSFDHLTSHFEEGAEWGAKLQFPILRNYDGVDFYTLPTPYYKDSISWKRVKNMWTFYKNAIKFLRPHNLVAKIRKPDIIIGSTVHPFAAYAGYKLSQSYHVPFVYEVRDLWPLSLVEGSKKVSKYNPIIIFWGYLDKKLAQTAHLIITTAPLMKDYYINNYHINEDKFIWITNGTSFIQNTPTNLRIINKDILQVGYTGVLGYANGLVEFLTALSTIPQSIQNHFLFTFVGNGPLRRLLEEYTQKQKLTNVRFLNPVPKNEIWGILSNFDMLLFSLAPSPIFRYGVSPNKLADYHAVGRPIIEILSAHDTPVLMAQSGYHIDHISDLQSLLVRILRDNESTYQVMANNARKFASKYYDWGQLAYRLNESLNNIERTQECAK